MLRLSRPADPSPPMPVCPSRLPLRKFQTYEIRVAQWLDGSMPAIGEQDVDVWQCTPFPTLTFQVKYSNMGAATGGMRWTWHAAKFRPDAPDYFILCGICEDTTEAWFVLPRRAMLAHSGSNGKGGLILQGNPQQFSRRGQSARSPGYIHENTIWRYHCPDPSNMIAHVQHQETLLQLALL
jgi:hypothetical protein